MSVEPDAARSARQGLAKVRVPGVDLARGIALLGMMAVHTIPLVEDGSPTVTGLVASGRSAAIFAVLAGVSLAFLSGGQTVVQGQQRRAAARGLVVRALLIGGIGLLLGFTDAVLVILPFYAAMFLLAIPALALTPRILVWLAATLIAVGPVILVMVRRAGVEFGERPDPNPITVLTDPLGVLGQLFITGEYPLVLYLAFVLVGLAIGRLDLSSKQLARRLLVTGVVLAAAAQAVSLVLLYPMGAMSRLLAEGERFAGHEHEQSATDLLWEPHQGGSWSYLALASPHGHTQLDMLHVLGSAIAVLGACLLMTRSDRARRVLQPVATAGAMTLTLYTAHILVLQTGLLEDYPGVLYLLLAVGAVLFAVVWRRWRGQGPLERLVAKASGRARRRVLEMARS